MSPAADMTLPVSASDLALATVAASAFSLCAAYRRASVVVTGNPESAFGFGIRLVEWLASDSRDSTPADVAEECEDAPESAPHDYTTSAYYAGIHALSSALVTRDPWEATRLIAASAKMFDELWIAATELRRVHGPRPELFMVFALPPPRPDLADVLRALGACDEDEDDAVPWSRPYGGDWERALAECSRRDWIFWLAGALFHCGHLKREVLVLCACACARSVLYLATAGEERPRLAVDTAERWARGEATREEVRAAREGANAAALRHGPASTVRYGFEAAACAALNAVRAADANELVVDIAARNAAASAAWATNGGGPGVLAIVKRELGPALLEGLAKYAATLPGAT